MAHNGRNFDPGTRAILTELRDLRVEMRADRRQSDDRFERLMRELHEDSAKREAVTHRAFKDIHALGLVIVIALKRHERFLERIDGKLGLRGNGRPGPENGHKG